MGRTNSVPAGCHPERPHYALGLCNACYRGMQLERSPELVEKARGYKQAWRQNNKHRDREYHLRKSYGLSPEAFAGLLAKQGGRCALCESDITGLAGKRSRARVDHCHETGVVRGLLCHSCNIGLGHLGDTVEHLEHALAYVRGGK